MKQLSINKFLIGFLFVLGVALIPTYKADAYVSQSEDAYVSQIDDDGGGGGDGGTTTPTANATIPTAATAFNLTANLDKPSYAPGDSITLTSLVSMSACLNTARNFLITGTIVDSGISPITISDFRDPNQALYGKTEYIDYGTTLYGGALFKAPSVAGDYIIRINTTYTYLPAKYIIKKTNGISYLYDMSNNIYYATNLPVHYFGTSGDDKEISTDSSGKVLKITSIGGYYNYGTGVDGQAFTGIVDEIRTLSLDVPFTVVTPSTGTWSYPLSCPTACGKAQSTQTETCTGGNGICSGTASTRTCGATAECTETPTGTWSYPSSCPTTCGLVASTQTQTCTGGNGSCSGIASTRTCNATAQCTETPTGTWSYLTSCPSCGVTSAFTQTQTCTGGNGSCSGTASTRTCPANATCQSEDKCPNTPGIQTTLPCPSSSPIGTLTGDNCEIAKNGNTCTTKLTWGITNPVSGAATNITKPVNIQVASGLIPASKSNIVVNYPSTTFYLNHDSETLAEKKINTICVNGTGWDATTSKCIEGGGGGTCSDGIKNQNETGVDTGGVCGTGNGTCTDGIKNGNETGIDIGGRCGNGTGTCSDGIKNQNETGIDTGGVCGTGSGTCSDGIKNQNETGIDTGGVCGSGNLLNITFTATPSKIFKGKSSVLAWTSTLGANCTAVSGPEFGTFSTGIGSPASGNTTETPTKTTRYKISCTRGNITETEEVTVQVNFINIKEI